MIKRLSLFVVPLMFATTAYAHFGGLPVILINGEFALPGVIDNAREYADLRDLPPKTSYPIGSTISYELKPEFIPIIPQDPSRVIFTWDYGDGSKVESGFKLIKTVHTYPDEGVYLLKVSVEVREGGFPSAPEVIQVVPITIGNPPKHSDQSPNYLVEPWSSSTEVQTAKSSNPGANMLVIAASAVLVILFAIAIRKNRAS